MRKLIFFLAAMPFFLSMIPAYGGCFSHNKRMLRLKIEKKFQEHLYGPERYEKSIDINGIYYSVEDLTKLNPRHLTVLGKNQLVKLVGTVFSKASLHVEGDSVEDTARKYIAASIVTAYSMEHLPPIISSPVSWRCNRTIENFMDNRRAYASSGLWRAMEEDRLNFLSKFPKSIRWLSHDLGRGGLAGWTIGSYIDDADFYLKERGYLLESSTIYNPEIMLIESEIYFLAVLVTRGYGIWKLLNHQILDELETGYDVPSKEEILNLAKNSDKILSEIDAHITFKPFRNQLVSLSSLLDVQ